MVGADDGGVEIDWKGIARSHRAISENQGDNIILLVTEDPLDQDQLNNLIPNEDGEFPSSGGWFAGPGGWLLLIEYGFVPVKPRLEQLAQSLEQAGIHGTITGARTFRRPTWSRPIENRPVWMSVFRYRQLPQYPSYRHTGWTCKPELLTALLDHLLNWAATDGGQLTIYLNLTADFAFDLATAKHMFRQQIETQLLSSAEGYNKNHNQLRRVRVARSGEVSMSLIAHQETWPAIIDELRTAMRTAPIEDLHFARMHHYGEFDYSNRTDYDEVIFSRHPELWDDYIPDPSGIQILTNKHLANATNLDNWNTTRLDQHHYLVQAKDLAPWYSQPLAYGQTPDPETLAQARTDFGTMIFTKNTAKQLGIN